MQRNKMKERVSFFVNRKEELAELKETDKHVVVVGHRRMGKTHLIIRHLLRLKKTIPVYLDVLYYASWEELANSLVDEFFLSYDETTGKKLYSLFRKFSSSISSALSSVKEIEGSFGLEGLKFLSLRLALKEKKKTEMDLLKGSLDLISDFSKRNHLNVVIALDEIQNINNYGNMEQGLAIIRGELQFSKSLQLIMSGSLPTFIHSQILEKSKPFWKQLKTMDLGPFRPEGVNEATSKMKIGEKHSEEVFNLTKGVPDYVVKVLREMKKGLDSSKAFRKVVADEELFFSSIISSLSKGEHIVLGRIAKGEGYPKIESTLGYPPTAILNGLIKKGLLRRVEKGMYSIVDPGLEYVLKKH